MCSVLSDGNIINSLQAIVSKKLAVYVSVGLTNTASLEIL